MFVFYIKESEVKKFMNALLKEEVFDNFEVRNVELETFVHYEISCNIKNDSNVEQNVQKRFFCLWSELKPYMFQLIKGKKKPHYFKIILSLQEDDILKISDNAAAMFLNVNFENDIIMCTTGTSQKKFTMDKIVDNIWEETVKQFFLDHNIKISENPD